MWDTANEPLRQGVRIYDTASSQRITYISRADDSPRADLFKCTLHWQDDRTLLIAWADFIKVAVVKSREGKRGQLGVGPAATELFVEVESIFQVDCMISGIAPHGDSYLILAYLTEETFDNEATENRDEQRRKAGSRPELRVISKDGEELSSDALSLRNYDRFQCRDYSLCPAPTDDSFYVISPQDIVVAKPRDEADHIAWLIEQRMYEKALEALENSGLTGLDGFDVTEVGKKYLEYLVQDREFSLVCSFARSLTPPYLGRSVLESGGDVSEDLGHQREALGGLGLPLCRQGPSSGAFASSPQLLELTLCETDHHSFRSDSRSSTQPTGLRDDPLPLSSPRQRRASFLPPSSRKERLTIRILLQALLRTIRAWPHDIYDVAAVILAIQDQIERKPNSKVLMESVAELFVSLFSPPSSHADPRRRFILNRQPGKALPYFLKLRRPGVFDLIRENNLFTDVQDQALLLIEFDQDVQKERLLRRGDTPSSEPPKHGTAIALLVDHTHSIPVSP